MTRKLVIGSGLVAAALVAVGCEPMSATKKTEPKAVAPADAAKATTEDAKNEILRPIQYNLGVMQQKLQGLKGEAAEKAKAKHDRVQKLMEELKAAPADKVKEVGAKLTEAADDLMKEIGLESPPYGRKE